MYQVRKLNSNFADSYLVIALSRSRPTDARRKSHFPIRFIRIIIIIIIIVNVCGWRALVAVVRRRHAFARRRVPSAAAASAWRTDNGWRRAASLSPYPSRTALRSHHHNNNNVVV